MVKVFTFIKMGIYTKEIFRIIKNMEEEWCSIQMEIDMKDNGKKTVFLDLVHIRIGQANILKEYIKIIYWTVKDNLHWIMVKNIKAVLWKEWKTEKVYILILMGLNFKDYGNRIKPTAMELFTIIIKVNIKVNLNKIKRVEMELWHHQKVNTLEAGCVIKKMGKESWIIKMEIFMKVNGRMV